MGMGSALRTHVCSVQLQSLTRSKAQTSSHVLEKRGVASFPSLVVRAPSATVFLPFNFIFVPPISTHYFPSDIIVAHLLSADV